MTTKVKYKKAGRNFYNDDPNFHRLLRELLRTDFFQWADGELKAYGELCANAIDKRAIHTDREGEPKLIRYDEMGEEISKVWVNEGYQQSVKDTYNTGIVGYIHKEIPALGTKGNYVYANALNYLLSQAEAGLACPVTLTKATAYLIDHYASDQLKDKYLPHVLATGDVELYEGATFLTERQGGSDVGANEVEAVREGDFYRISGEKYFASNAGTCGVAMVLARLDDAPKGIKGLSLFLVPWEENRVAGQLRIRRMKDKLGVRAVPSAEVEFMGATGYLVGEENKGFYYMIEALNLSRVSNAVASLGIMRRAYIEAKEYAEDRPAFGQQLTRYPMVQATLSHMVAKQEVEMNAMFEIVAMMDRVMGVDTRTTATDQEQALFRLYVAIMKIETAKQAIQFSHEAIEMHGGNGYIEDFVTPRLLRDAQVLTVWEGTENILGLEVLRLMKTYDIDRLFADEMGERLNQARVLVNKKENTSLNTISSWIDKVMDELTLATTKIDEVKQLSDDLQTYYCKDVAKWMVDLYESVIAIETALKNGQREVAMAEVFLENLWSASGVHAEPASLKYFHTLNT